MCTTMLTPSIEEHLTDLCWTRTSGGRQKAVMKTRSYKYPLPDYGALWVSCGVFIWMMRYILEFFE